MIEESWESKSSDFSYMQQAAFIFQYKILARTLKHLNMTKNKQLNDFSSTTARIKELSN